MRVREVGRDDAADGRDGARRGAPPAAVPSAAGGLAEYHATKTPEQ
ncbi:hypothetical protein [Streptomyces sp. NRRL S-340]|nr:hypothetical protein [Streptomyces sp. NRRL S-340]